MKLKNLLHSSKFARIGVLIAFSIGVMGIASGQSSFSIVFDSTGIDEDGASYDSDSNTSQIQSASWIRGSGLNAKTFGSNFQDTFNSQRARTSSLANAIANDDYYTVTLTPNEALNFESIEIAVGAQNSGASAALLSDATGFVAGSEIATLTVDGNSETVDVSSISALAGVSSAIEFRVYFWNAGSFSLTRLGGVTFSGETATAITLTSEQKAARFLTQATMGPKYQEILDLAAEIDANGELPALEAWIDAQMALDQTLLYDTIIDEGNTNYTRLHRSWWTNAIDAPDQLRQITTFALSQILVTSVLPNKANGYAWSQYYDMLGSHVFGNYRDALYDVTISPIMGFYLSHLKNAKADPALGTSPDENYAREIMQLFSIGLYELELNGLRKTDGNGDEIPTYTNAQITEFAEVFTGFGFNKTKSWHKIDNAPTDYFTDMFMYDESHDTSEKLLLDYPGAVNGGVIPAFVDDPAIEEEGLADVSFAVDNLFNHPNVGPFIARLLIQRMVTSNPSTDYIEDVARTFNDDTDNTHDPSNSNGYTGERGNMAAVFKEILLHDEARNPNMLSDVEHGKLIDTASRITHMGRALNLQKETDDVTYVMYNLADDIGMQPTTPPSVFNFYLPDYQPPGAIEDVGLVGPEFEIMTDFFAINVPNRQKTGLEDGIGNFGNNAFDLSELETYVSQNGDEALVDRLNLTFARGLMTDDTRTSIVDAIDGLSDTEKVELAVYLTVFSAESTVLR